MFILCGGKIRILKGRKTKYLLMGSVEGWILKAGLLAYEDVISRAAAPLIT